MSFGLSSHEVKGMMKELLALLYFILSSFSEGIKLSKPPKVYHSEHISCKTGLEQNKRIYKLKVIKEISVTNRKGVSTNPKEKVVYNQSLKSVIDIINASKFQQFLPLQIINTKQMGI